MDQMSNLITGATCPFLVERTIEGRAIYETPDPDPTDIAWALLASINWESFEPAVRAAMSAKDKNNAHRWDDPEQSVVFVRFSDSAIVFVGLCYSESGAQSSRILTRDGDGLMLNHLKEGITRGGFAAIVTSERERRSQERKAVFAAKEPISREGLDMTAIEADRKLADTDETLLARVIALENL